MRWPEGGIGGERAAADALDHYWDSLAGSHPGGPLHPDVMLDPALSRTVRQLRGVEEAPRPDPAFAASLWGNLMAAGAAPVPVPAPPSPVALSPAGGAGRLPAWPRRRVLVELAVAAALLVAVLGNGVSLKLPVSLPSVPPTAAASAGAPGRAGLGLDVACARTVTPAPTRTGLILAAPTADPAPTAPTGTAASC